jgi:hypothetical protein
MRSRARAARKNSPAFFPLTEPDYRNFNGLLASNGKKVRVELFCFYPTLANTFVPHFFVWLRPNVVANKHVPSAVRAVAASHGT